MGTTGNAYSNEAGLERDWPDLETIPSSYIGYTTQNSSHEARSDAVVRNDDNCPYCLNQNMDRWASFFPEPENKPIRLRYYHLLISDDASQGWLIFRGNAANFQMPLFGKKSSKIQTTLWNKSLVKRRVSYLHFCKALNACIAEWLFLGVTRPFFLLACCCLSELLA